MLTKGQHVTIVLDQLKDDDMFQTATIRINSIRTHIQTLPSSTIYKVLTVSRCDVLIMPVGYDLDETESIAWQSTYVEKDHLQPVSLLTKETIC